MARILCCRDHPAATTATPLHEAASADFSASVPALTAPQELQQNPSQEVWGEPPNALVQNTVAAACTSRPPRSPSKGVRRNSVVLLCLFCRACVRCAGLCGVGGITVPWGPSRSGVSVICVHPQYVSSGAGAGLGPGLHGARCGRPYGAPKERKTLEGRDKAVQTTRTRTCASAAQGSPLLRSPFLRYVIRPPTGGRHVLQLQTTVCVESSLTSTRRGHKGKGHACGSQGWADLLYNPPKRAWSKDWRHAVVEAVFGLCDDVSSLLLGGGCVDAKTKGASTMHRCHCCCVHRGCVGPRTRVWAGRGVWQELQFNVLLGFAITFDFQVSNGCVGQATAPLSRTMRRSEVYPFSTPCTLLYMGNWWYSTSPHLLRIACAPSFWGSERV